jgi:hypothetical protein
MELVQKRSLKRAQMNARIETVLLAICAVCLVATGYFLYLAWTTLWQTDGGESRYFSYLTCKAGV